MTDLLRMPIRGDPTGIRKREAIPAIWIRGDGKLMYSGSQAGRAATPIFKDHRKDRVVRQRSSVPQAVRIPGLPIRNLPEIQAAVIRRAVHPGAGQTSSGLLPAVHRELLIPAVQEVPVRGVARISAAVEGGDRWPLLTGI